MPNWCTDDATCRCINCNPRAWEEDWKRIREQTQQLPLDLPEPSLCTRRATSDDDMFYLPKCTVIKDRERDKAILVSLDPDEHGIGNEMWIPRSQIHEDSEVKGGVDTGTLIITRWLALKKGLVEEE